MAAVMKLNSVVYALSSRSMHVADIPCDLVNKTSKVTSTGNRPILVREFVREFVKFRVNRESLGRA